MWKPKVAVNSKPRQQQDLVQQAPIFVQPLAFFGLQAMQPLKQLQLGDFFAQPADAADRVVVGKSDDIEPAGLGGVQQIEIGGFGLLIVARSRGM